MHLLDTTSRMRLWPIVRFRRSHSEHEQKRPHKKGDPPEAGYIRGAKRHNAGRRKRISAALMTSKVCKSSDAWHGARVQEGGRVLIISGDKDQITKSAQRSGDFVGSPNDQLKLVNYVGAGHLTPLLHADTLVPGIEELQERNFARFTEIAVR